MDKNNRLLLMQSQLRAWRTSGLGQHKPEFWIAASNSFDAFYFWRHEDFVPILDRSRNNQDTVTLEQIRICRGLPATYPYLLNKPGGFAMVSL